MDQQSGQPEVLQKFSQLVARSLHIPVETVVPDANLTDLGAESLDVLDITMQSEEMFNISIPDKTILQTADLVFGPGVLEKEGFLTQAGKDLLRARTPDIDPALLEGDLSVADVNTYFMRVSSWARMIEMLAEHTPKVCPACGGE